MFKKIAAAAILAGSLVMASGADAAILVEYGLDGSLANSGALGSATIQNNASAGSLGATGVTFGANQGPTIGGLGLLTTYTIETQFSFGDLGGYRKIADFLGSSDTGLYALYDDLTFYGGAGGAGNDFAENQLARVVLTRNGANSLVTGYVNGFQRLSFTDSSNLAVINSTLRLFQDDTYNGGEASAGFVDYIRVYDQALTGAQVEALTPPVANGGVGAVPEPATWAMMLLGFFGLGGVLRRRSAIAPITA